MTILPLNPRLREWLSVLAAIAIGPVFLVLGYSANLMFGLAAAAYFWVCAVVVPLLTYAAGRLKFVVWQLAVVDLALSTVADDLRVGMRMHAREVFSVSYTFWVLGTFLSSPLPIYFLLRPLPRRRSYVVGCLILVVALALYLGLGLLPR
jgi:hypothetical protein